MSNCRKSVSPRISYISENLSAICVHVYGNELGMTGESPDGQSEESIRSTLKFYL